MLKFSLRTLLVVLVSVAALCVTVPPAFASTTSKVPTHPVITNAHSSTGNPCHTLRVSLYGNRYGGVAKCLDSSSPNNSSSPDTVATNCNSRDIRIYQDANYSGNVICFANTGFVNMTDYGLDFFHDWNDQASSFNTFGYNVRFFKDINGKVLR